MNDLGWSLTWLAAQVALVLGPALMLHALATRRGPASGAWVATLGLGLVVVLVPLAFVPAIEPRAGLPAERASTVTAPRAPVAELSGRGGRLVEPESPEVSRPRGRTLEELRSAWARLGRRAAGPAARFRPWGRALAVVALAGSGVGLLRLMVGLWAVGHCRRRGRRVEDPGLLGLVDELRGAMGVVRGVELREVPDLTTPATAGWLRPMLLLPDDWRGWNESERRAVVAHELAHVIRGDYASGLVARVAVVLHAYHPMVRWLAGRLHLQQELAADALGARFAGGRSSYLVALSRLALKQDGRSPTWPARAFLPARGTLIRRIAMLRNETDSKTSGRAWSKARRLATALGLLALTIGVANWKLPARAQEFKLGTVDVSTAVARRTSTDPEVVMPFDVRFIPERMNEVIAFRPAATAKRAGMAGMTAWLRELMADDFAALAKQLNIDIDRPGFRKLSCEDIESVAVGMMTDKVPGVAGKPDKTPPGPPMHRLMMSGVTVRAVAPIDWLAFLRQWKLELEEVREGRGSYYKLTGPGKIPANLAFAFFLPDDRTLVIDDPKWIKELAGREVQAAPSFLRGADWERVSRGILAFAIDNQGDRFAKDYDLGRPDDAVVLSLFRGVDRWTIGVADRDDIAVRVEATGRDPQSAEAVSRSVEALAKLGLKALENPKALEEDFPEARAQALASRLAKGLLAGLKPEQAGPSLAIRVEGIGAIADVLTLIQVDFAGKQADAKAQEAKAVSKSEKR